MVLAMHDDGRLLAGVVDRLLERFVEPEAYSSAGSAMKRLRSIVVFSLMELFLASSFTVNAKPPSSHRTKKTGRPLLITYPVGPAGGPLFQR